MKSLIVAGFLFLCGCAKHDPAKEVHFRYADGTASPFEATIETQLAALSTADPIADAEKAYRRGDYRLVGVLGIGVFTPGVQLESSFRLLGPAQKIGVKIVTGTTDSPASNRQDLINTHADEYAKAYNVQMIVLLTTGGKKGRG